jgi:hypothetical protein
MKWAVIGRAIQDTRMTLRLCLILAAPALPPAAAALLVLALRH